MSSHLNSKHFTFSVLMANYNNAKFIELAIDSVLNQTYPHWELIIVDDCSTDNSIDKIKEYLYDKRIKLIRHKINHGYGGALKTAAANANHKILAILDPDDKLHENALEIIAQEYQKCPDCGFIYSTMWHCDSNLNKLTINPWIGPIIPEKTNIFHPKVAHLKTFLKEAYLNTSGFDPNLRISNDKDIIYKLEEITKFHYINIPLYYYRFHGSGISRGKKQFNAWVENYIAKCKAYQRRLNTELPNLTLKSLYIDFFRIKFRYQMICFKFILNNLRILIIIKKIEIRFPSLIKKVRNNLNFLFNKLILKSDNSKSRFY